MELRGLADRNIGFFHAYSVGLFSFRKARACLTKNQGVYCKKNRVPTHSSFFILYK